MHWRTTAEQMLSSMQDALLRFPTAFAQWACAADFAVGPVQEVAILADSQAPASGELVDTLWKVYRPRTVAAISAYPPPDGSPSLLGDRPLVEHHPTAYVCRGLVCLLPVTSAAEMERQLLSPAAS